MPVYYCYARERRGGIMARHEVEAASHAEAVAAGQTWIMVYAAEIGRAPLSLEVWLRSTLVYPAPDSIEGLAPDE